MSERVISVRYVCVVFFGFLLGAIKHVRIGDFRSHARRCLRWSLFCVCVRFHSCRPAGPGGIGCARCNILISPHVASFAFDGRCPHESMRSCNPRRTHRNAKVLVIKSFDIFAHVASCVFGAFVACWVACCTDGRVMTATECNWIGGVDLRWTASVRCEASEWPMWLKVMKCMSLVIMQLLDLYWISFFRKFLQEIYENLLFLEPWKIIIHTQKSFTIKLVRLLLLFAQICYLRSPIGGNHIIIIPNHNHIIIIPDVIIRIVCRFLYYERCHFQKWVSMRSIPMNIDYLETYK